MPYFPQRVPNFAFWAATSREDCHQPDKSASQCVPPHITETDADPRVTDPWEPERSIRPMVAIIVVIAVASLVPILGIPLLGYLGSRPSG